MRGRKKSNVGLDGIKKGIKDAFYENFQKHLSPLWKILNFSLWPWASVSASFLRTRIRLNRAIRVLIKTTYLFCLFQFALCSTPKTDIMNQSVCSALVPERLCGGVSSVRAAKHAGVRQRLHLQGNQQIQITTRGVLWNVKTSHFIALSCKCIFSLWDILQEI